MGSMYKALLLHVKICYFKEKQANCSIVNSPRCLFDRTSFLFERTTEKQTGFSDFSKANKRSLLFQGKQLVVFEI